MSAEIPALVPAEIRIGDTVTFKRKWNDYTVDDGWQLDFLIVKDDGTANHSWTATDNGDGYHLVTIPAVDGTPDGTAELSVGIWGYAERLSKSGEIKTKASGRITVLPDLASASDIRTHAKIVLDAVEAVLQERATQSQLSMSIAGRSLSLMSPAELIVFRDEYRREVRREKDAERIANGLGTKGKIEVRF